MEISLYNDSVFKVFATVNGINFIIEPGTTSVARCADGLPVTIHLSRKKKSWTILNLFEWDEIFDFWESAGLLELEPTYVLNCTDGNNMFFRIVDDTFNCDKYYQYNRLCLDEPLIKNNCTYEIIRQKKLQKRVKMFNVYTAMVAVGILDLIIAYFISDATLATFFESRWWQECSLWLMAIMFWGICGKIRVIRRYKKVTNQNFMHDCFNGRVAEYVHK